MFILQYRYFCWTNVCLFFYTVAFIQQIKLLEVAAELSSQVNSLVCNAGSILFFSQAFPTLLLLLPLGIYDHVLLEIFISLQVSVPKIPFLLFLSFLAGHLFRDDVSPLEE